MKNLGAIIINPFTPSLRPNLYAVNQSVSSMQFSIALVIVLLAQRFFCFGIFHVSIIGTRRRSASFQQCWVLYCLTQLWRYSRLLELFYYKPHWSFGDCIQYGMRLPRLVLYSAVWNSSQVLILNAFKWYSVYHHSKPSVVGFEVINGFLIWSEWTCPSDDSRSAPVSLYSLRVSVHHSRVTPLEQ